MTDRLFGLPGAVLEGTGMNSLIPNTANWNITTINSDLADIYLSRVSYSWTLDEHGNIVINNERKNYEYLLGKVDLITQNFDSSLGDSSILMITMIGLVVYTMQLNS